MGAVMAIADPSGRDPSR